LRGRQSRAHAGKRRPDVAHETLADFRYDMTQQAVGIATGNDLAST
jgi:hypothetical protein